MGNCGSSQEKNAAPLNLSGPGLPPQQIISQPVEVVNLEPSSQQNIPTQNNTNISATPNINEIKTNIGTNSLDNINNSLNNGNNININGQTINNTQIVSIPMKPNDYLLGSKYANGTNRRRLYIVVQMPGRELDVNKLYEDNTLLDLEEFIAPDTIDEFNFYNSDNYSLDDLLERPFNEWHNINKTLRIKLVRAGLHIPNEVRKYIAKRTYLIGGLTFDKPNTFGLFIFNKMNNSTLSFEYSTNIYLQLKTVNQFSAYCNALNKLYISGGELSNNIITDSFLSIHNYVISEKKDIGIV